MFFIIAGIQPKTIDLEKQPRICPSCGLYQASLKRIDHYVSIFFLPIIRLRRGSPFLECKRCGSMSHESGEIWFRSQERQPGSICSHCKKSIEPEFRFCPFCGKPA
ncbi:MAG: zinc ribbon domain-containing protein [Desulfobacteraceae bacterium]|nr:zinc ribbon domain-containing protein [Desulfobacteraceae bacterium]